MSGYEQKWEWFMGGENPKKQQGGECSFFTNFSNHRISLTEV